MAVVVGRFTAFLRAVVPGLAGMSVDAVPHLPPRQRGRRARSGEPAYCLLGYVLGHAYTKVEHASGIASDVLLGLVVVAIVVLVIRRRRRERPDASRRATGDSETAGDRPSQGRLRPAVERRAVP